jgi:hypothetical protein
MGQYYMPCSLTDNKEHVKSYVYSHHIKIRWKTADGRMVTTGVGLKLMEHSYLTSKMMLCVEALLIEGGEWHKTPIVWSGDYSDAVRGELNYFTMCERTDEGEHIARELIPKPLTQKQAKEFRFIVNHTKKEFVDKTRVPSVDGWQIHPLSLLTAEGNGRGGGDFEGIGEKFVGTWARDIISVEKELPEGYKQIRPYFIED